MSWMVLVAVVVAVAAELLTLWMALLLVERSLKSITKMCIGVVRTLLGQSDPDDEEVRYESDVGSTSPLFETQPGWQYWGQTVGDEVPEVPRMPEGPHLGGEE